MKLELQFIWDNYKALKLPDIEQINDPFFARIQSLKIMKNDLEN